MYIVAQTPLSHTRDDFWQLITEQKSRILINLHPSGKSLEGYKDIFFVQLSKAVNIEISDFQNAWITDKACSSTRVYDMV